MIRRLISCLFLCAFVFPAKAQDAADAVVRLNRVENQVRQLSGQIEQLQFENRQLKELLQKFQADVDFRFKDSAGGKGAGSNVPVPNSARPAQPQRRGDAFDPNQVPDAPGAPRPLGSTSPSAPLTAEAGAPPPQDAPLALPGGTLAGIGDLIEEDQETAGEGERPLDLGGTARSGETVPAPPAAPSIAAAGSADPRLDYEVAYAAFQQKQYEGAEMGFRRFIQSHPRDKLVPDAMYWLGESYLQRNRTREAAEQFLNVSTDHPKAEKAPDALLKLGVALNTLGAKDRACAVLAELDRKYPQASPSVRQTSEREQKRIHCA